MLWVFPLHQQLSQVHVTYTSVPVSVHMAKNQSTDKGCRRGHVRRHLPPGDHCLCTHTALWLGEAFILPRSLPSKHNRREQPGRHS